MLAPRSLAWRVSVVSNRIAATSAPTPHPARRAMVRPTCLSVILSCLVVGLVAAFAGLSAQAQGQPKDLQWTHAFDLACRKLGEDKFTKDTQKFGVEGF